MGESRSDKDTKLMKNPTFVRTLLVALLLVPVMSVTCLADDSKPQRLAQLASSAPQKTMQTQFPLRASANNRYLVDANNKPFFYQADTPWMMLLQLTVPEAEEYMADRKAKGFSALQIMLTGFYGMKNRAGHLPFVDDDFAKPNEAFWAHADKVVQKASDMGMFLMIAPLWSGCCGEGWAGKDKAGKLKPLNVNGPEKAHQWGRWIGQRYGKFNNIAWLMGGDKNPGESHELIRQLARGLHETAPRHLIAVHNAPENSSAAYYDDQPWLTLNAAYTYKEVFGHVLGEWKREKNTRPIFLSESGYERESNDGRGGLPFRLRRQAYGAVLSGALVGHAYGHRDLWRVNDKWRESLQDTGAKQMALVSRLFAARDWWKLEPEAAEDLITQGRGKAGSDDYITAARTGDGTLAIVYLPKARTVTVNLARFIAPLRASWFDPTDGSLKPVQAEVLPNIGTREFAPPEKNAAGESDWVLLLEGNP